MENKKTTELLNELANLEDNDYDTGGKYKDLMAELVSREPFFTWFHQDIDDTLPTAIDDIKELQAEVKKLKRHKHDDKSGDVLIRI